MQNALVFAGRKRSSSSLPQYFVQPRLDLVQLLLRGPSEHLSDPIHRQGPDLVELDLEHRTVWPACCGTGPRPAPGSLFAALLTMASAMLPLLSPRLRGSARAPAPRDDTSDRSVL